MILSSTHLPSESTTKIMATSANVVTKVVNNTKVLDERSTIGDFFYGKNVFITGGTGFLGTVLIEAILGTSPHIGTIYVLVRDKYGSNANTRIQRMLTKPIFESYSSESLKKVVPVIGELNEPNFGMKPEVMKNLLNSVNIIYHSAATIKFKSPLRQAIQTNLIGTQRTIEFAKNLKNLSAYVYLSTAFCNSNHRGFIQEKVYQSEQDPYEMIRLAHDDTKWTNVDNIELDTKLLIGDHPNTYTFTKQLAENLIMKELHGLPAGIVRPSVVYGTYEHPVQGWVGNANSGHLGLLAGYVKGIFRTISGNPQSIIDVIPCDYVINSSITMGWYVGTRSIETPEVIHCTSGEINPLTLERFRDILNANASKDPCDAIVWMPNAKIRNGWRYTLFFYLFHYFPAILIYLPETIFQLGKPHHTALGYMRVFDKGTKAFDYFLNKEFRYSLNNSLRIMSTLNGVDAKRYRFDASECDWSLLIERCFLGLRRFYYRESYTTTWYHTIMYKLFEILNYIGWVVILAIMYFTVLPIAGSSFWSMVVAFAMWSFLVWL